MRNVTFWIALVLAGCGDAPAAIDAGTDAGTIEIDAGGGDDAGRDAGGDMDAGRDAGTPADGGSDAGATDFDAGRVGTCVSAPIQVLPTCPVFTPCGGELSGSWCYTGVCIEEREFTEAAAPCPVTLRDFTGSIVGRVEFSAGTQVHRETLTHVEGTIDVPSFCLTIAGLSCMDIEDTARSSLGPDATVDCTSDGEGGCECAVTLDSSLDRTDDYTTSATAITVGSGATERTYDYCVDPGVSFRFRERPGEGAEPGVQSAAPAI